MEGDGGIIVLMEERVNSTYKWGYVNFCDGCSNNSDTYNVWCWSVCFILERRICTYEYGDWIVSKCCKYRTAILYAFVGRLLDQYNEKLLISISSFLLGGSFLLTNMVNGFNGLLFVLLLVGTFYSVSQPGGSKVIMKWFSKRKSRVSDGD